jgi:hypothetical protein
MPPGFSSGGRSCRISAIADNDRFVAENALRDHRHPGAVQRIGWSLQDRRSRLAKLGFSGNITIRCLAPPFRAGQCPAPV